MSVPWQGQSSPFLEQVQNRRPRRASGQLQGYNEWQAGCGIRESSMLSRATTALLSVQHLQRCCLAWAISHNCERSMSSAASFAASWSSSSCHYHRLPIYSCCSASSLSGPAAAAYGVDSKAMARIGGGAEQTLEHVATTTGAEIGPEGWVRPGAKSKQIYCNRSLNMKGIVAVGFDMDYTLAQYKPETFEVLAYTGTIRKLVHNLGYPVELLDWEFDWKYMVRGLVLDKKRGNILKMDRHKYVKVAHHGFKALSREDRASTYGSALCRESFDEPDYALIDTLFSLAEAYLFAQLVTLKDSCPEKLAPDYFQMYSDVRAAVDLCHRDGTLKLAVAKNPGKYINEDNKILPMVKMLRESGKLTFLVTNSLWDYTDVVMNYLFGKTGIEGGLPRSHDWLTYFDIVITGSAKPAFFKEGNHAPLLKVDVQSGMLQNTDNGSPLVEVGGRAAVQTVAKLDQKVLPSQGWRVFQGGGVAHLHKLLHIAASAQVMYVGDHIYGDILRSKKALGWRTMLVVPELESELDLLQETAGIHKEVQKLRYQRNALEDTLHQLEWELKHAGTYDEKTALQSELRPVQMQRDAVREQHRQEQRECHHKFHKVWGQLMKTGYQNSRFAHQVERFACLYTSQVTNLCNYSPDKTYRTSEDYMPHEMDVYSP